MGLNTQTCLSLNNKDFFLQGKITCIRAVNLKINDVELENA